MNSISTLSPTHRPNMLSHLLTLSEHDRHLRFGSCVSEHSLAQYIARINFSSDVVIGVFNSDNELLGFAHGAVHIRSQSIEIGLSIDGSLQGQGFGRRLVEHILLEAQTRGLETAVIQTLSQNHALKRILQHQNWVGKHDGPEFVARLTLANLQFDNLATRKLLSSSKRM